MSEWCCRSQCSWFCFLFHLTGGASHRSLCPVRTRPIVSPTFFVCFSLSMNFFAVTWIFDFYGILYCCTSIIWVTPNKTVKKINRRSVPPLSRALLGQLNIVWSQDKLSHCKLQGRYPITRFQFLQISQHYIDRRNQQIMQMCSQFSEHSTCTQSDEYSRCCLMKIGYLLYLRKIGMVVMISSSTFQSTTICC